jgi:HK97 family phage portal protein
MWPFSSTATAVAVAAAERPAQERTAPAGTDGDVITPSAGPVVGVHILPPRRDDAGSAVSVDVALSHATVYRCISLIVGLISGLEMYAVRGGKPMRSLPPLLREPTIGQPLRQTLALTATALCTHGNAYWLVTRGGPGEPASSVDVLDPTTVSVESDSRTGEPIYRRTRFDGRQIEWPSWQRQHLQLMRRPGRLTGLGPLEAGQAEIRGAIDARDYASRWWRSNNGVPKDGYLATNEPLTRAEVQTYREQMEQLHRDGRIPVLGNGLRMVYSHLNPQEALWTEASSHYSATIARLFGVPSTLVDERSGGSETYSNVNDKRLALLSQTLGTYIGELEAAFSALLPAGTTAKFDTSQLFAVDQGVTTARDNDVVTTTDTNAAPVQQTDQSAPVGGGDV